MLRCWLLIGLSLVLLATSYGQLYAAEPTPPPVSPQLQKCLQRADDLPDIAAAEATAWLKKNGGADAHLCHAFAEANRGQHHDAAREFWALAMLYEKTDAGRAVTLHNFAGQEFLRAKDPRSALAHYATSLRLSPANTDALIGHAESYMASERYWEAVDDLNRVIATQPKNLIALRQRGRAWLQLGNDKNAQEDFERAEAMNPPAANEAAKP